MLKINRVFVAVSICVLLAGCMNTKTISFNVVLCNALDELVSRIDDAMIANGCEIVYGENHGVVVYDNSSSGNNSSSAANNSSSPDASSEQTSASKKPSKPVYTQEQIDAAWEETSLTEPTCVEVGVIEYENSITHDTKTEEIPLVDHVYKMTETVDATCTTDGHKTYTCELCKDSYDEGIPATGHGESVTAITTASDWFSEGVETEYCSICNDELSILVIPQKSPISFNTFIAIIVGIICITVVLFAWIIRKK